MRTHPIGTGPFQFVEFKANESIKLTKNPDYFKEGLPHSTASNSPSSPTVRRPSSDLSRQVRHDFPDRGIDPLLKERQVSRRLMRFAWSNRFNVSTNIIVNSSSPPFDNIDIRRALALALDRKAFVSIMFEGQADIGGTMLPAPGGLWRCRRKCWSRSRVTAPTSTPTGKKRAS